MRGFTENLESECRESFSGQTLLPDKRAGPVNKGDSVVCVEWRASVRTGKGNYH